jgi:hypothetical protein
MDRKCSRRGNGSTRPSTVIEPYQNRTFNV